MRADTNAIVPISIRELGTTTLGKIQVLTWEAGQPWRVPGDGIVELIWRVEPEVIPEHSFVRRHRPRHVESDHPSLLWEM